MKRFTSLVCIMTAAFTLPAIAAPLMNTGVEADVGRVTVLHVAYAVESAAVSNPDVAEVQILDDRTIGITGKSMGISTLEIRDEAGRHRLTLDVMVGSGNSHPNAIALSQSKDAEASPSYVCGKARCIRAAVVKPLQHLASATLDN